MGVGDKVSGRIKKAAGDLVDDPDLRRRGGQEERKGEAKEELLRRDEAAARKAREVEDLERRTEGRVVAGGATGATREELYAEARRLGVEGRSRMNKEELRRAVERRR